MKVPPVKYAQLIYDSTKSLNEKDASLVLAKIARLIIKNGDKAKFSKIVKEFKTLFNKKQGIVEAEIVTSDISFKNTDFLRKKMAKEFGTKEEKIKLKQSVNPQILGGIIISVENKVFDGSIKSKLERLKSLIAN
jgi:F-type H+-transporting ATPase subunit delta